MFYVISFINIIINIKIVKFSKKEVVLLIISNLVE